MNDFSITSWQKKGSASLRIPPGSASHHAVSVLGISLDILKTFADTVDGNAPQVLGGIIAVNFPDFKVESSLALVVKKIIKHIHVILPSVSALFVVMAILPCLISIVNRFFHVFMRFFLMPDSPLTV